MEIFKELPHEFIPPEDLPSLLRDKSKRKKEEARNKRVSDIVANENKNQYAGPKLDKVYGVHLKVSDYVEHKSGSSMQDYQDYLHNPHSYRSVFADKVKQYKRE